MSHQTVSTNLPPDSLNSGKDETHSTRLIRDRSVPTWAAILSSLFTFGTAVCTLALVVFALFLHQLVAVENIEIYAPILGLSALVPVLGIVLFELGHARSLAGYHDLRRRSGPIGGVIAAVLTAGGLAMLHPLLLLPPLVGGLWGGSYHDHSPACCRGNGPGTPSRRRLHRFLADAINVGCPC